MSADSETATTWIDRNGGYGRLAGVQFTAEQGGHRYRFRLVGQKGNAAIVGRETWLVPRTEYPIMNCDDLPSLGFVVCSGELTNPREFGSRYSDRPDEYARQSR